MVINLEMQHYHLYGRDGKYIGPINTYGEQAARALGAVTYAVDAGNIGVSDKYLGETVPKAAQ